MSEEEARALLVSRGFPDFVLEYRTGKLPGLSWFCEIKKVWAPVVGTKARGFGFTPLDAALKALACNPVLITGTIEE